MINEENVHTETAETDDATEATEKGLQTAKTAIINAIDENGNGEIDIEDIIIKGLKTPGIRINRAEFLQKQLFQMIELEYGIQHQFRKLLN